MSQVITNAFEQYWQSSLAAEQPVVLDEFILADIPNLDITSPIDPDAGLPPESQIVHRQNVDQRGRINTNAVAYSIVMDTTVGDFSFNAMYLRNKANGVIGMIVYKGRETKLKTDQTTGQTGNSLVKSMLMGYDQAAEATLTNVDAGTWQIDYAARLRGQDEDLRQLASQLYGHHTFIGDGFKVVQLAGGHQVTPGVAIIGGLRVELKAPEVIHPGTKPIGVWVDVHRSGSLLSEHQNNFTIITSVADLTDHVDSNGYPHYVAKLGTVQADSTVVDGRQGGNGGASGFPHTFALWKHAMAEAGYDLIGQFGTKLTIQNTKQVLLSKDGTEVYAWLGALPKDVPADGTMENTGGIGIGTWKPVASMLLRSKFEGPAANGFDDFYGGGGWTGSQAGSGNLQGPLHTNAMRWRYDIKASPSLDPVIWVEKESIADVGDTSTGDTGANGGAGYFAVKKSAGSAGGSTLTGYARHNGGGGGMIGVLGRGHAAHIDAQVWGVWAYAEVGFGAQTTGVEQAIAIESNNCNRGPDQGWMSGTGPGASRGVLSITADGTNRCTHAYYIGNHKAGGGSPGVGGWWTGFLVAANSIAANTNASPTYVGDGEAFRVNGSGQSAHAYGGFRFYEGNFRYGTSYIEGNYVNNAAILMGPGKRIIWGQHAGSSRHMDYDDINNWLSINNMGLAMTGVKVLGPRSTGIFQLSGTADGSTKNTETMTLVELARYTKKLTDALINHGLIGPT